MTHSHVNLFTSRRRERDLSLGGIVGLDLRMGSASASGEVSDAECDLESLQSLQQTMRLGEQPRVLQMPQMPLALPAHVVFGSRTGTIGQDFTIAV